MPKPEPPLLGSKDNRFADDAALLHIQHLYDDGGAQSAEKDALLAEWTGLLDRIKARFSEADLDELDQEIRAVLIELATAAATPIESQPS
jgi:hypothetical protein